MIKRSGNGRNFEIPLERGASFAEINQPTSLKHSTLTAITGFFSDTGVSIVSNHSSSGANLAEIHLGCDRSRAHSPRCCKRSTVQTKRPCPGDILEKKISRTFSGRPEQLYHNTQWLQTTQLHPEAKCVPVLYDEKGSCLYRSERVC